MTDPTNRVHLIVAMTPDRIIGIGNALPWRIKEDMAHFKRLTSTRPEGPTKAVIMGRKTWESIPLKSRPLHDRLNIVVARTLAGPGKQLKEGPGTEYDRLICGDNGVMWVTSLGRALKEAQFGCEPWIIGGAQIYAEALRLGVVSDLHITLVTRQLQPLAPCTYPSCVEGRIPIEDGLGKCPACARVYFPEIDFTSWRIVGLNDLAEGVTYNHYRRI